ncbi:MAG: Unknown protein [uncultured Thiotrichaceae bacterium]|uniref:Uncharacterized protein n=1 Tax=uncultured Thiotrichaceae bacterium TaxID=298394 RepID=A0A6S6U5D0_9GAMM|nr:MAG: Unknown protein [uncultured Thiotrichaceae bacterium]
MSKHSVLRLTDISFEEIASLLNKYHLELHLSEATEEIPGSFWGDDEAGLIANKIYARPTTPIHSILHESCHYICMDDARRDDLDTNAGGDYDEENAVCYLQILLAKHLPSMGTPRMLQDMDTWGYTFRLGSAQAWFENDAEDAQQWLQSHKLIQSNNKLRYTLRD